MEEALKALGIFIDLFVKGCDGGPCFTPRPGAAVVRPADPLPCVKPWAYGETKVQHKAKPCPVTALEPAGIQQP